MTTKAELKKNFADLIGADDDETLEEFYASYKDGVVNAHRDMLKAIAAGDFLAVRQAAHALKGIALTANHQEAMDISLAVSAAAKQEQMDPIRDLAAKLQELCNQL